MRAWVGGGRDGREGGREGKEGGWMDGREGEWIYGWIIDATASADGWLIGIGS